MKVIEKKRMGRSQKYLVSIPANELRLLTAVLNGVVKTAGVGTVVDSTPWSEKTITQLQHQLDEALDADITEPS